VTSSPTPTTLDRAAALRELRDLAGGTGAEHAREIAALGTHWGPAARLHTLADLMAPDGAPHITVASPANYRNDDEAGRAYEQMLARVQALEEQQREERERARARFLAARLLELEGISRTLAEQKRGDLDRRLAMAAEKIVGAAVAVVASVLGREGDYGPTHYDAALVMSWGPVIDAWLTDHAAEIAAWDVLLSEGPTPPDPATIDELRRAVQALLPAALTAIQFAPVVPADERDGMLELDARAADYVADMGNPGSPLRRHAVSRANSIRGDARERLREAKAQVHAAGWPPPAPWERWRDGRALARILAATIWQGELKADVEARRVKPPGLPFRVYASVTRATTPRLELVGGCVLRPNPSKPRHGDAVPVATLPASAAEGVVHAVQHGLRDVGGRYALPLVESIVAAAHTRYLATGSTAEAERIEFDGGGWDAVACAVLEKREIHPEERSAIRRISLALANMPLNWLDGARSSSLWLVDESAAAAGRGRGRARVVFKLSERAVWGEVFRGAKGQRVVPLPRPRNVAPLPLSPRNTYGPQAVFLRLLWLFFTDHSAELTAPGALVTFEGAARTRLADEAQLFRRLVPGLLEHLVRERALVGDGERFAPADQAARDFLRAGAERGAATAKVAAVRANRRR
jgi:hypothetical protein